MPNLTIEQHLLTPNPYSRPSLPLRAVHKIIIHWVANPVTSALVNRNYFENLKHGTRNIYASSHYIVGLFGEIFQCIPDTELAYHAKNANTYSLGIEVCHLDWEGAFSTETYNALINLLVHLCHKYTLDPQKDILRHYDVTGKVCPKYYVHHPAYWTKLKEDVVTCYTKTYLGLPTSTYPHAIKDPSATYQPTSIRLKLNGTVKTVSAFTINDCHYVRLRDLADNTLCITFDPLLGLPCLSVKQ
nr:peptidoglycan recognition family protein [uncultured Niameybacter sp.]